MSDETKPTLPPLDAARARDIARGHIALAEQYRFGGMADVAQEYDRLAELWLAYARTLMVVGNEQPPQRVSDPADQLSPNQLRSQKP